MGIKMNLSYNTQTGDLEILHEDGTELGWAIVTGRDGKFRLFDLKYTGRMLVDTYNTFEEAFNVASQWT